MDGIVMLGGLLLGIGAFWLGLIVGVSVGEHWAATENDEDSD